MDPTLRIFRALHSWLIPQTQAPITTVVNMAPTMLIAHLCPVRLCVYTRRSWRRARRCPEASRATLNLAGYRINCKVATQRLQVAATFYCPTSASVAVSCRVLPATVVHCMHHSFHSALLLRLIGGNALTCWCEINAGRNALRCISVATT